MLYFTRLRFCRFVLLATLLLLTHLHAQSQQPNIIYIMTDDMGYADLSGYGRKDYATPHLDKLAAEGMKFVNAYSAGPLCTPTRTAFMTGRYPARTPVGLIEPLTGEQKDTAVGLTKAHPSIATLLNKAGYETALVGKWHLGIGAQHSPMKNGFEHFFGFYSGAADYISHMGEGRRHDLYENEQPVYPQGYLTDLFAQKAISFIRQSHSKPFFLNVMFNAPHWPWQGPADAPYPDSVNYRKGGSPAIYAAMMKSLDDAVGNIIAAADSELPGGRHTMIIFTNDNGGERFSDHGGLAKAKGSLWEGGIKVPAFVRWTGNIKAGSITQQVATTMDWTATILYAGAAKADKDFPLDGINLLPVLTGAQKEAERTLYWRTFQRSKQKALRQGHWKYLQDEQGEYLFNLVADPWEQNNLKTNEEAIFNRLKKKYMAWEKTMLPPIPL